MENHYECLRKVFQLIRNLNLSFSETTMKDKAKMEELWNRLRSLLNSSAKAEVIAFMGYYFHMVYLTFLSYSFTSGVALLTMIKNLARK